MSAHLIRAILTGAAITLATSTCVLAASSTAHAQSDTAQAATARALFTDGVAHAQRGEYEAAADRFRRAYALRPTSAIAFNLASALIHEGELVEASELLSRVLRDGSISAEMRASAERQRERIAPRIARLELSLDGEHDGVRVEIDGEELPAAAIGVAVPIDPSAHEVRALRGTREVATARVELAEGARSTLALEIPDEPAAETARAETIGAPEVPRAALEGSPIDSGSGGGDEGWIALGVGIAVVAVGAAVVTTVVLTAPAAPLPVGGNTMPGVIEW